MTVVQKNARALKAVQKDGYALEYASNNMKNNYNILLISCSI